MTTRIPFEPKFEAAEHRATLRAAVAKVLKGKLEWTDVCSAATTEFRDRQSSDTVRYAICLCLLRDLSEHGWLVHPGRDGITLERPNTDLGGGLRAEIQTSVRAALASIRDRQLAEPSVRAFVTRMTREGRGSNRLSVFRLMRDGVSLGRAIRAMEAVGTEDPTESLRLLVKPYLQFVDEDAVDEWTGHRLVDIWRYFRHTWLTPYRSTPGRSMMILVRDASVVPHAVIGIAALASPIVRQGNRDRGAGIDPDTIVEELRQSATGKDVDWLRGKLDEQIDGIYCEDFLRLGLVTRAELASPTSTAILALQEQAKRIEPNSAEEVVRGGRWSSLPMLVQEAESPLFTKKRAVALASLLFTKRTLTSALEDGTGARLREALSNPEPRDALARLLRSVKNDRAGTSMMDINVCGAVAPYNEILGGKLVALLMLSPEVRAEYARRYGEAESVIASRMAGRTVTKSAELVLLTTSGIFPGRSSQYNRLTLPGDLFDCDGAVTYEACGATEAFSTIHLSDETVKLLAEAFELEQSYRHVNSKFGEGVSPRLRKVRQQFDRMDLDSDALLRTGHSRTVYVVKLCRNSSEFMMGRAESPDYILKSDDPLMATERIAEFWRNRWLKPRLSHKPALARLACHNANFPSFHGASVKLPRDPMPTLFEEEDQIWVEDDDVE